MLTRKRKTGSRDHSEPDSEAELQLHANQEQAASASATGQPSDIECDSVVHNEADQNLTDTVPAGNGINGFEKNRSDNEIKENAEAADEIPSDATKETEQSQNVHRESDSHSDQMLDGNQDQADSASRILQQSDTERGSAVVSKAGEDQPETQPEPDKRSGRDVNENEDNCHDDPPEADNETEECHCKRSELDSDTDKTTDAEHSQALSTSGMGQQSDTERDSAIGNEADEDQPETVPGEWMQGFEENLRNIEIKDNSDTSNGIPPFHAPKETEQTQNVQSESNKGTEQRLNDNGDQAKSASGTVQQSDTKCERAMPSEQPEEKAETPSEAEYQSDKGSTEKADSSHKVPPAAHEEMEELHSDSSESNSEAEQKLDVDQDRAVSASGTVQQSDTQCDSAVHNEADEDQVESVTGEERNELEENRSDNEIKENAEAADEIPSDATKETEQSQNVHRESDSHSDQMLDGNQDQADSASRILQQSDTERGSAVVSKAGEDQPETQPEPDKRSGRDVNENEDNCHDDPPEADNETEERHCKRSELDSDTDKTTDAEHSQALSTSGMGQQSDTERESAIGNEADEDQPETVPGEWMQGFEENLRNIEIKDNSDTSNGIPPFHAPKETEQTQNVQSESNKGTEQRLNDNGDQAKSASGTVQQSDTKCERAMPSEQPEEKAETPSEAEYQSDKGSTEKADSSHKVPPAAHEEMEELHSDSSESNSEAEQKLDVDQDRAVSASGTVQQSDTQCDSAVHNEADEDQVESVTGEERNELEENRSDNEIKENAEAADEIPSDATKETEQSQNVHRESDSHSDQMLDGNQDQADSASRILQQSDTERGSAVVSKAGEDQPETQPEPDKRSGRDVNENEDNCHDDPPEADNETEERHCKRSELDSDTDKTTDAEHSQALSTSGMGQQSDTERESAIGNEADEDQPETVPGEWMQGFEENLRNIEIKDNSDTSNGIPPFHAPKETEQTQNVQSESNKGTEQRLNDNGDQAKSASGTVQQSDTKCERAMPSEQPEEKAETPSEAEYQSDKGSTEKADSSHKVPPAAHEEMEELHSDSSESNSEAEQKLDVDQDRAVSASGTVQQSDTQCDSAVHNEADEDQVESVTGEERNELEENRSDNDKVAPSMRSSWTEQSFQNERLFNVNFDNSFCQQFANAGVRIAGVVAQFR
ncbi:dentin sialophosphoprotein-like [Pristis pectinata]|uniref:dentin sialophosphoprotein-like n=1 Tax=Pristis pectinata TaxID=685728 RepID=UPI00223D8BF1|nr:dentin sialophosphoprotein-like [Pristis pectinata]